MAGVYSVAQVNSYIKNMFAQDFLLRRLSVKGEVSNCKYHSSGHIYFTLKDGGGTLQAVMSARTVLIASIILESSPPEATSPSGLGGILPGFVEIKNSTSSEPAAVK